MIQLNGTQIEVLRMLVKPSPRPQGVHHRTLAILVCGGYAKRVPTDEGPRWERTEKGAAAAKFVPVALPPMSQCPLSGHPDATTNMPKGGA